MTARLHRFAQFTSAWTLLVIVAGGLVTSTDSGLAVPDWPLSYGTLFPPMIGGIRYEHSHRLIAGLAGLLILGLAAWLWRAEPRRWVRRLGLAALLGVLMQAVLGGLTVLLVLPAPVSIAHACLGPLVFCAVASIAWAVAPARHGTSSSQERDSLRSLRSAARIVPPRSATADVLIRNLSVVVTVLLFIQLVLGAVVRHTGGGVAWHVAGAAAVLGIVSALAVLAWPTALRRVAAGLLAGVCGQLLLGMTALAHREAALVTAAHQAFGAALLATAWVIVLTAWEGATSKERAALRARIADYIALTKPRLTLLAVVSAVVGFLMAARPPAWGLLLQTLIGSALVGAGANALNQWLERDADALMRRTQHRPLPAGRLSPRAARTFGWACSALGVAWLALMTSPLAGALGLLTVAIYVGVYTPLKRVTSLCTLAGAIPGALPPLIGWAAASGTLSAGAWALFAILFLWQLPHFLALAWIHREDYARAGFRMLPVLDPDGAITGRQMVLYGLALIPVSLFPTILGVAGPYYFFGAALAGLWFLGVTVMAACRPSSALAGRVFTASISYLPVVLGLMVIDRVPA